MNELTIIQQHGGAYIDSREVAEAIGKRHDHLLRDITGYLKTLENANVPKIGGVDFFIKTAYEDAKGETRPCYLISKMGCEMVANKLTGEKGVLFTAAYVSKFNEMEQRERAELEALAAMPAPRLGEINACARIIVRGLRHLGASPDAIMRFLKDTYEMFGITVPVETETETFELPSRWYTATEIAVECGIYSLNDRPHSQAVACILNENIFIGEEHKYVSTEDYNGHAGASVRYDDFAKIEVMQWLVDNRLPDEIYGFERTYYVQYHMDTE